MLRAQLRDLPGDLADLTTTFHCLVPHLPALARRGSADRNKGQENEDNSAGRNGLACPRLVEQPQHCDRTGGNKECADHERLVRAGSRWQRVTASRHTPRVRRMGEQTAAFGYAGEAVPPLSSSPSLIRQMRSNQSAAADNAIAAIAAMPATNTMRRR